MKRRALLLMVTMTAALIVAGGVALAEGVTCDIDPPCYGTPEGDDIGGTTSGETIYAMGGADSVFAAGGNDTVYGADGSEDSIAGEGGDDTLYGQGGNDAVNAGFNDSPGSTDRSYGGGGNDSMLAADGNVDVINCGKGTDEVEYDQALDTIKACENKQAF